MRRSGSNDQRESTAPDFPLRLCALARDSFTEKLNSGTTLDECLWIVRARLIRSLDDQ
jgi:hypothetical protein